MREWSTEASGDSSADGLFAFRGFHGDYEITTTPREGDPMTQRIQVTPGPPAQPLTILSK
jgi:hypothetical protein